MYRKCSNLKETGRYTFLILDAYHLDNEQGCEDPWLSSEDKRGPQAKQLAKHCTRHSPNLQVNEDSSPLAGYTMSIYKCKCTLTTKASQMKTLKKMISSFRADKFDTSLLFATWSPLCSVHVLQHFINIWITQEEKLMLCKLSN